MFGYFANKAPATPIEPPKITPEEINISIDLIDIAKKLLDLLEYFAKSLQNVSFQDPFFRLLCKQYTKFLLQKKAEPKNTTAPSNPAVHYFWYCHVLRPKEYSNFLAKFLPNCNQSMMNFDLSIPAKEKEEKLNFALWETEEDEDSVLGATAETILLNQMTQALANYPISPESLKQELTWLPSFHSVAFPLNYRDTTFLQKQLKYYKRFLAVVYNSQMNENSMINGPHIGIDLIWHSHILSGFYLQDCQQISEEIPSHHPHLDPETPELVFDTKLSSCFKAAYGKRMEASLFFKDPFPVDPLSVLPNEIFLEIVNKLPLNDLLVCSHVNTAWRKIVTISQRWKQSYTCFRDSDNQTTLGERRNLALLTSSPTFSEVILDFENRFPTEISEPKSPMAFFLEMLESRYQLERKFAPRNVLVASSRYKWLILWQQEMEFMKKPRSTLHSKPKQQCGICLIC